MKAEYVEELSFQTHVILLIDFTPQSQFNYIIYHHWSKYGRKATTIHHCTEREEIPFRKMCVFDKRLQIMKLEYAAARHLEHGLYQRYLKVR